MFHHVSGSLLIGGFLTEYGGINKLFFMYLVQKILTLVYSMANLK